MLDETSNKGMILVESKSEIIIFHFSVNYEVTKLGLKVRAKGLIYTKFRELSSF